MATAQLMWRYHVGELLVVDENDDKRVPPRQRGWHLCRHLFARRPGQGDSHQAAFASLRRAAIFYQAGTRILTVDAEKKICKEVQKRDDNKNSVT